MMVLRCSSSASGIAELVERSSALEGALLLSPKAVRTKKELEAAFEMAKNAFSEGTALSPRMQNETLMFLSCESNFSSAARKIGAASPDDFVLVLQKKVPSAKLRKTLLLTSAQALRLSEWGGKKGHYSEGELAIEKMAIARIRN